MELVLGAAVLIGAPDLVTIARSIPRPRTRSAWPVVLTVAAAQLVLALAALRYGGA